MMVFNIIDQKAMKQMTLGNESITLRVPHMAEGEWRARNDEVRATTQPTYAVNQLDEDIAMMERNERNHQSDSCNGELIARIAEASYQSANNRG